MSDNNLRYYEQLKTVPTNAKEEIKGGRISGKTSISPMWRIKKLTEIFGPVGVGWKYDIVSREIIEGANGEKATFVDIDLQYKDGDVWSEKIRGTGGAMFVVQETKGPHTNDECFKMALTDAISVAGKAIGLGADVYANEDDNKYKSTDDLSIHSILKIRQRVQETLTAKATSTGSMQEVCKALGVTEKQVKTLLDYYGKLATFEKRLRGI